VAGYSVVGDNKMVSIKMGYGLVDGKNLSTDESVFPVQSSVLDEDALFLGIVQEYRIPTPDSCRFLTRGDADIYRVKTTTGSFYLKIYRPPQSLELTEAEASFVFALSASGIPVVKPVRRTDGRFASQVRAPEGTRPMLLFEKAPPPLPALLDEALLLQIGEKVAMFHVVADRLDTDYGIAEMQSDEFLREHVYNTSRFLSRSDRAFLGSVSEQLSLILERLPRKAPDFGLCHADLVMSNLRLAPEGIITIFDFGSVLKTWRAFELAIVYWSLGNRYRDRRDQLWKAFLQGYESVRVLPEALPEYLSAMLILRQISFLGGNCATLPLRLGTEPFESGFIEEGMTRLRACVEESGIQNVLACN
jgi:Ser/Thr protein kinase RdoA (MazF antagonist)